jgi:hypothetical protein
MYDDIMGWGGDSDRDEMMRYIQIRSLIDILIGLNTR